MGLFGKKEIVGEFVTEHYPNGELVFRHSFRPNMWNYTVMAFSLYAGKMVYDLEKNRAEKLWQSLFAMATDAFNLREKGGLPLEQQKLTTNVPYKVVSWSTATNPLKETAKFVVNNGDLFCETYSSPITYPDIEDRVVAGVETVFVHLFNTENKQIKFFLPIVVMSQCNWYQEHGLPSIHNLRDASMQGIAIMVHLVSEAQKQQ